MSGTVVVVAAKRSAFGKYMGGLAEVDPVDLAAQVASACMSGPVDLKPAVEQVFVGNCLPAAFETGSVVGRQIALRLGLDRFSTTIDTACCSPLTALRIAANGICARDFECALVVGVEVMSRVPHLVRGARGGVRIGPMTLVDPIYPIEYAGFSPVSVDAGSGAARYGVTKRDMDQWALRSHQRWDAANRQGLFAEEIAPVQVRGPRGTSTLWVDESPRPETTLARIEALPTVFGAATITAGNAPGLNDGAAAMVIMSPEKARAVGAEPLCTITGQQGCTEDPHGIAWVPGVAIRKTLERTGTPLSQVRLIEINEAFAAMPLVSTRVLAGDDEVLWNDLLFRTNVNGGAVAIGHPVGASGLRIVGTLARELRRRGGGTGVAAICGGLSQAEAVLIQVGEGRHE